MHAHTHTHTHTHSHPHIDTLILWLCGSEYPQFVWIGQRRVVEAFVTVEGSCKMANATQR